MFITVKEYKDKQQKGLQISITKEVWIKEEKGNENGMDIFTNCIFTDC